jgi:hypothetical protein
VRVGNVHHSAGREPIRSLAAWTGAVPPTRPVERHGPLLRFKAQLSFVPLARNAQAKQWIMKVMPFLSRWRSNTTPNP